MCLARHLLVIVLVVALSACASAPDSAEQRLTDTPEPAPALDLPMPEQTRLLIRVQPEEFDALVDVGAPYLKALGAPAAAQASPVRYIVAGLLGQPRGWLPPFERQFEGLEEVSTALEAFDGSRAVVVALSTRGNEEHLRHLVAGVPPTGARSMFQGFSTRLFIPAADADQLRRQLEDFCEGPQRDCSQVQRIGTHADYAVVDSHSGPFGALRDEFEAGPVVDTWDGVDPDYGRRTTPAMRTFLGSQAAVSVYVRGEDLPVLGAFVGSIEAFQALHMATPQNRRRMMNRAFSIIGDILDIASPEVREFEDLAVAVGADANAGLFIESSRSFTRRGAELADGERATLQLVADAPREPILEVAWMKRAAADVELPRWMRRLAEDDDPAAGFVERFRMGGIWMYGVVLANYPRAFAAGARHLLASTSNLGYVGEPFELWNTLRAVYASLGWEADQAATFGAVPRGFVSIVAAPGSSWPQAINYAVAAARSAGIDVSLDTRKHGDHEVFELSFGEPHVSDIPIELSEGECEATLDLSGLAIQLEQAAMPGASLQAEVLEALQAAGTLRLGYRESSSGQVARLYMGPGSPGALAVPSSGVPLTQPEPQPECLQQMRWASREVLAAQNAAGSRAKLSGASQLDVMDPVAKCPEDERVAEERDWIRSRWMTYAGRALVQSGEWGRAAELLDEACEAGDESACDDVEAVRGMSSQVRLAAVSRVDASVEELAGGAMLTGKGLVTIALGVFMPARLNQVIAATDILRRSDEDALDGDLREFEALPTVRIEARRRGAVQAVTLIVDRSVSSALFGRVVDLIARRDLARLRREARLLGEPDVPDGPLWTAVAVQRKAEEAAEHELLFFGSARHLERSTRPQVVLDLHDEGIDVSVAGAAGDAIEGCPTDGPTICVTDAARVKEQIERAGRAEADEPIEVATLAQLYRLEALRAHLDEVHTGAAPVVVIHAEVDVPFDVLAQIHATMGRWADAHGWEARLVIVLD